jgi:hypothetical protein
MGVLTMLEGDALLIRDNLKLAAAEGLAMFSGDILETGGNGRHVRIEFSDGSMVSMGPDSRMQLAPGLTGNRAAAAQKVYLLNGWLKLTASKTTMGVATANFDLTGITRSVVVQLLPRSAAFFVEAGETTLRTLQGAGTTTRLKGGDFVSPARPGAGGGKTEITARPSPAFLQGLPRAFLDERPPRAAGFAGKEVRPVKIGEPSYADLRYWINGEGALRRANLERLRPLAQDPAFRQALQGDMRAHPEWEAVLAAP